MPKSTGKKLTRVVAFKAIADSVIVLHETMHDSGNFKRFEWLPGEDTSYEYQIRTGWGAELVPRTKETYDDLDIAIQIYNSIKLVPNSP